MKKKQNKKRTKKFKWCMDWLLIGYVIQTILLIIIVYGDGEFTKMNWPIFISIPYMFWFIEMMKTNSGRF